MHVWIIEIGEPLPGIDQNARDWRCGMLSKALVGQGHDVTWWASTFDHATKRHRFEGPRVVETMPGLQISLLHGPGYVRNSSPKRILHHWTVAHSFAREAARSSRPDVVFCCLPTLDLAERAVTYGQKTGIPVLIDIRDLWPDHYLTLVPKPLRGLLRLALFTEFRRARCLLREATGITAISKTYLNWGLRNAGRERQETDGIFPMSYPSTLTSSNAMLITRREELASQYGLRPDHLVVTFVGTFVSSFDLETVIEAGRTLESSGQSGVRIVLVGDGGDGPRLRAQAQGLGNVIFTGWFDQASIVAMLGLSSVGLAPYRDDASMSLPNKPYEYMAAGLPLLSSLRGELEELIHAEGIGLQYRAGGVASLVDRIRWLATNPEARREMGERSHNLFSERFAAEITYPGLVDHLEWVAGRGR